MRLKSGFRMFGKAASVELYSSCGCEQREPIRPQHMPPLAMGWLARLDQFPCPGQERYKLSAAKLSL